MSLRAFAEAVLVHAFLADRCDGHLTASAKVFLPLKGLALDRPWKILVSVSHSKLARFRALTLLYPLFH